MYVSNLRATGCHHLITAATSGFLAVSIVTSAVHLAFLPEVNHVYQKFTAGAAHKARRVPQFVIAGPLGIDGRLAQQHGLLTVMARLEKEKRKTVVNLIELPNNLKSVLFLWMKTFYFHQ